MIESDLIKLSDGQPVAVLVVDDDPILRSTLAYEIRDAGYLVREASNTDEAERILAADTLIDVVVTDIEMPGPRDGLALAKSVRAFKPHIKVIVASGLVPRTGVVGIADAFFGKPYDFTRILMRIKSLLQPPREANQR
jgi:DNA-binding NtrC family response regulator